MARAIEERVLAQHIIMLANDGTANHRSLKQQVVLYQAPADKRAIIKDVRVNWLPNYPGAEEVQQGSPPASVTKNDLILSVSNGMGLVRSEATGTDEPDGIYFPNFSGGEKSSLVLEPGEELILTWAWITSADVTFDNYIGARVSGVEVQL